MSQLVSAMTLMSLIQTELGLILVLKGGIRNQIALELPPGMLHISSAGFCNLKRPDLDPSYPYPHLTQQLTWLLCVHLSSFIGQNQGLKASQSKHSGITHFQSCSLLMSLFSPSWT